MKYIIRNTKRFDKDLKRCAKRGFPMRHIAEAMRILSETGTLPLKYRPHKLVGDYAGLWECHISGPNSDWLMVWDQNDNELTLLMLRTGSHSDLF